MKPATKMPTKTQAGEQGFTLVELLSVMAVTLLFSGLIVFFAFDYWRSSVSLESNQEVFVGRLTAGDFLRDTLDASTGLIIQNDLPDTYTNNPDPADPSNNFWIPIHAVPQTITAGSSSTTPLIYFRQPSIDASKNILMNGVAPYEDNRILYIDGGRKQLLMRTLANNLASGNRAVTSCPPDSATASCPADKVVAQDVASVDMRYFSRSGNPIDHNSIVDPLTGEFIGPDFTAVEVVEFNIHSFRKSTLHGGTDTVNETIIRVALRN